MTLAQITTSCIRTYHELLRVNPKRCRELCRRHQAMIDGGTVLIKGRPASTTNLFMLTEVMGQSVNHFKRERRWKLNRGASAFVKKFMKLCRRADIAYAADSVRGRRRGVVALGDRCDVAKLGVVAGIPCTNGTKARDLLIGYYWSQVTAAIWKRFDPTSTPVRDERVVSSEPDLTALSITAGTTR